MPSSLSPRFPRAHVRPSAPRRALALLLTLLASLAGPASPVQARQTAPQEAAPSAAAPSADKTGYAGNVLVIYRDETGATTCREATGEEKLRLGNALHGGSLGDDAAGDRRVIYAGGGASGLVQGEGRDAAAQDALAASLLPSAGLRIVLHGTQQLQNNPTARDAFVVAANRWEALISTQMTVVLDVDYGTTFFGSPFPSSNTIGATGTTETSRRYSTVRQQLLAATPGAEETALYNALPASSVPVELDGNSTSTSSIRLAATVARALGFVPDITNPDALPLGQGDAGIGFNSAFNFDFTPGDGITPGQLDFDAVVVHEIGHALGFSSESGAGSAGPLTLLDLFRLRPSAVVLTSLAAARRVMSAGGQQAFYSNRTNTFGGNELGLSTGGPAGDAGDGEQSSHWKADEQSGSHIGIMDPTLSSGVRETITSNDLLALDTFGFKIGGTMAAPPPAPPVSRPANDNFANAVVLQGASGSVGGDNFDATAQAGEPDPSGDPVDGTRSVWYFWTAPASGLVTMDTLGSDYDTTLGAYTGTNFNSLTPAGPNAQNDDIENGVIRTSRITFDATAGTVYRIMVNGWRSDTGSFTLNWTGPGAQPSTFRISGRVVDNLGNGLDAATVELFGATSGRTTSDASGNYAFSALPAGTYTLIASKSGFSAGAQTVTINSDHALDLPMSPAAITVSGFIRDAQNNPIPGAGYTVTSLPNTVIGANANGFYSTNISPTAAAPVTITPVKYGYTFSPASATFTSAGGNQAASFTGTLNNPIDASTLFVTQHYRDFLGREPDQAGLDFWRTGIEQCGPLAPCTESKRVDTSAAFFLSIEFQETGGLVYRMWKVAYANIGTTPIPVRRAEFMADSALVAKDVQVGVGSWQQQLEANKNAYADTFASRPVFKGKFDPMTNEQYVDALNLNSEFALSPAERDDLVRALNNNTLTRPQVLRAVAEDETLRQSQVRRAFVLMQYFGYLRRDPDAPDFQGNPDPQFLGYNFWLDKLNQFNGSYIDAEMVKAFITSIEYRRRFGQ